MPLSADPAPLRRDGDRVFIHTVREQDVPAYRHAVGLSRERIRPWNPVNAEDLAYHLRQQSDLHRTFLIRAQSRWRTGDHDIVGKVNVTGITRGRAFSGVLGYDAYDPYAGRGLFADGLRLVVDLAFTAAPKGLGLNRVEAAVQPGNVTSAGVLRSLGFRRRGTYPRYLWLADGSGDETWRDHLVYGIDRAHWPSAPYPADLPPRPLVIVRSRGAGIGEREVTAARALAVELGVPVLREPDVGDARSLADHLDDAVSGAVLLLSRDTDAPVRAPVVAAADLATPAAVTRIGLRVLADAFAGPRGDHEW